MTIITPQETKLFTLYGLCRPDDKQIRYIGITSRPLRRRLRLHIVQKGFNSHKDRWIAKMAPLEPEIIPYAIELSYEEACFLEIQVIKELREKSFDLINIRDGGQGGVRFHSEESRRRLSESRRGSGNPMFGKPAWNRGIPQSSEAKAKVSASLKGRKQTLESVEKRRASMTGKRWSWTLEARLARSQKMKGVKRGPRKKKYGNNI